MRSVLFDFLPATAMFFILSHGRTTCSFSLESKQASERWFIKALITPSGSLHTSHRTHTAQGECRKMLHFGRWRLRCDSFTLNSDLSRDTHHAKVSYIACEIFIQIAFFFFNEIMKLAQSFVAQCRRVMVCEWWKSVKQFVTCVTWIKSRYLQNGRTHGRGEI